MQKLARFFHELKRRNVFRAGAAYLVLAWLLIQVADILLDAFGAAEGIMQFVIVALAVGFPITLVLSWVYEITIEGVKRTEDVAIEESITYVTGRKLDFIIIGVLTVAVMMFAIDRFVWDEVEYDPNTITRNYSIAVLPIHPIADQIDPLFGEMLIDVTRVLRRSHQLRIASEDAVDALPDQGSLVDIAAQLGVQYLVSGVVSLSGDDLILSVSLFDSDAGQEVWTAVFENAHLPHTINQVAEAILREINASTISRPPSTTNARAYELYLTGRRFLAIDPLSDEAELLFREAITLDHRFAPALAGLCSFLVTRYRRLAEIDDFEEAERYCHRAWTIDAESVEVLLALGDLYNATGQLEKARESYSAALAINPNDYQAQVAIAGTYTEKDPEFAEIQLGRIAELHPGSPDVYTSLGILCFRHGRYEEAVEQFVWVVRLLPNDEQAKINLSTSLLSAGRFSEARSILAPLQGDESTRSGDIDSNLATILFYEGDYAGAADLYRDGVNREPENSMLYRNLGDAIWHLEGKSAAEPIFLNAIQVAERELEINPDDIVSLSTLVVASSSIGDFERFQTLKIRYLTEYANDPYTHYDIAVAASRLEDMETAQLHANEALRLGYAVAMLRADPDIAASGALFD